MKILIVGVSTRAMTRSAVAAGYEVISLDYFGDRDQPAGTQVFSLWRDFHRSLTLRNLAMAAGKLVKHADALVIGAGLENEPAFFDLAGKQELWCNPPDAVRKARDLHLVARVLSGSGMCIPRTILSGQPLPSQGRWLAKDLSRSGGNGIKFWKGKSRLNEYSVLQEFIEGKLASAAFIANGRDALLLGMTHQFAGIKALNAGAFSWCGNVAPLIDEGLQQIIIEACRRLTAEFGLTGINGMDFIIKGKQPHLIEINPRYSGSVELFESLLGINAFSLHVQSCQGCLPDDLSRAPAGIFHGKAILYAGKKVTLGITDNWMENNIADIPHTGETISKGAPVCTLMGNEKTPEACWQGLLQKAEQLQAMIESE